MAISSSSSLSGAAAAAAKPAAGTDAKGKLSAFGPGTPVYPPERMPPQPQGRGTPPGVPAAAAPNLRAGVPQGTAVRAPDPGTPASPTADPRAEAPENLPFALTDSVSTATDTGKPNLPALTSRPKPKSTAPEAAPSAAAVLSQIPLLLVSASPAPATTLAPTQAAAPSAADASGAAAAAPGPFPADLPVNLPSAPGARGAFQATASGKQAPLDANPDVNAATDPSAASPPAPAGAIPVKVTPSPTPPTNGGSSAASVDTQSSGTGSSSTPDPSLLSIDFNPTHAAAESSAVAPQVQTPVGVSGWTEEVGAHVIFMAHQGISAASLRVQPEHLGPIQVRISVHDSTASVWFGASEPETRTALQAALPQLKEMFVAQGMTLADASVSREPPRETPTPRAALSNSNPPVAGLDSSAVVTHTRRGLIDTYA